MRNQGDRAGSFFLKRRVANGIWYICWYNPSTGQADRFSTGTTDRETARAALYEHALKHDRPAPASDAQLAHVMQTCWVNYGQHLPSAHTHLADDELVQARQSAAPGTRCDHGLRLEARSPRQGSGLFARGTGRAVQCSE